MLDTLAHGLRYFLGLAHAKPDLTYSIAYHYKDTEAEAFASLYDLADAVDGDYALKEFISPGAVRFIAGSFFRHVSLPPLRTSGRLRGPRRQELLSCHDTHGRLCQTRLR